MPNSRRGVIDPGCFDGVCAGDDLPLQVEKTKTELNTIGQIREGDTLNLLRQRMLANSRGYFSELWPFLVAAGLAASADCYSTMRFMTSDGIQDELHPVIRLVSYLLGPVAGPLFGKLCQFVALLCLAMLWRKHARAILIPVTLIYTYAAWFNLWGSEIYTPLFVKLLLMR